MSVSKERKNHKLKTDELEKLLEQTHPGDMDSYLNDMEDELLDQDREFTIYFNEKLKEKHLKKRDVFLWADIGNGYGSKLITMEKTTRRRDVILRLLYAAHFTLDEAQHALRLYPMPLLYARNARDALIMSCLHNRPGDVIEINELLLKNGFEPLCSCGSLD